MTYLLDTNIIIDYLRGREGVVELVKSKISEGFGVSTISMAELYHGAGKSSKPKENVLRLKEFVGIPMIELLEVDNRVACEYGVLMSKLEKKGIKIAAVDLLIAATAKCFKLKIITRDKKHFARLVKFGVRMEII